MGFWAQAKEPYPLGAILKVDLASVNSWEDSKAIATFLIHDEVFSKRLASDCADEIRARVEETLPVMEWPTFSMGADSFTLIRPEEWSRDDLENYVSVIRRLAEYRFWDISELLPA